MSCGSSSISDMSSWGIWAPSSLPNPPTAAGAAAWQQWQHCLHLPDLLLLAGALCHLQLQSEGSISCPGHSNALSRSQGLQENVVCCSWGNHTQPVWHHVLLLKPCLALQVLLYTKVSKSTSLASSMLSPFQMSLGIHNYHELLNQSKLIKLSLLTTKTTPNHPEMGALAWHCSLCHTQIPADTATLPSGFAATKISSRGAAAADLWLKHRPQEQGLMHDNQLLLWHKATAHQAPSLLSCSQWKFFIIHLNGNRIEPVIWPAVK